MVSCSKCGKEVGPLYCGKCRAKIEKVDNPFDKVRLVPLLYYDKVSKGYRAGCTCLKCPYNRQGVCITLILFMDNLKGILHEFDGDNIVQQWCG